MSAILCALVLGPVICSIVVLILCAIQRNPLPRSRRTLFVIAHPDDETMFFSPSIQGVLQDGGAVYLLCVSTGNAEGQGVKRKYELGKAAKVLGIEQGNVTLLDYENFKDGMKMWGREYLGRVILRHMKILEVDTVVTFDEAGVSAHPNHTSCFRAMQYLYSYGHIPAGVQVFVLETVSRWRKYFIPLDACVSAVHSTFLYVNSPFGCLTTWRAMCQHRSQLLWFRYLYMAFSRYAWINTLKRIQLQDRFYKFNPK